MAFETISVAHPSTAVLKAPPNLGLYGTRNFYINYHDSIEEKNVSLGVWHMLPNNIAKKFAKELGLTEVINLNFSRYIQYSELSLLFGCVLIRIQILSSIE